MRIDPYGISFRDCATCYTTARENAKVCTARWFSYVWLCVSCDLASLRENLIILSWHLTQRRQAAKKNRKISHYTLLNRSMEDCLSDGDSSVHQSAFFLMNVGTSKSSVRLGFDWGRAGSSAAGAYRGAVVTGMAAPAPIDTVIGSR